MERKKRQTAYRLSISQMQNGEQVFDETSRFSFVSLKDKEGNEINASRINVAANIVDKYSSEGEQKYSSLTLDDGTGQIRIKAFGEDTNKMNDIQIGDTITAIGFLRVYNNELYLLPEIIQRVDPKWLLVRKLESIKKYGDIENVQSNSVQQNSKPQQEKEPELDIEEEKISMPINMPEKKDELGILKDKIIEKLKSSNEEMNMEALILSLNEPVEQINSAINELLEFNAIYEPKPGTLRLL